MVTDYNDIIERLTKRREFQINLKDIFNADDLEEAIKKSFDASGRRDNLTKNKEELFDTGDIQQAIVDNSITAIEKTTSLDELDATFDNITATLAEVSKADEIKIETAQAEKQRELLREEPEELTKEDIFELGLRSVRKLSTELGLSIEDTKTLLIDKDFTLFSDDKQFKQ